MCFSASASFGAAAVLSVIGVASIKKATRPSQFVFAAIPLLFCVQQIAEGFLWLSLSQQEYASLQRSCTYTFLFFAQVVWPACVPLSILLIEKNKQRKKILRIVTVFGAVVSLYLGFCLLNYHVDSGIIGHHIDYEQDYPERLSNYAAVLYIIATVAPPFISGIKRMWLLGMAVFVSYIVTTIFYTDYVVSVWCFFASVISIAVLAIMHNINRQITKPFSVAA